MADASVAPAPTPGMAARIVAVVERLARSPRRAALLIFALSAALGIAMLPWVPRGAIAPHTQWEVEAVAVSLATTGTFADPYALPTGPTAHMPPAYPALLALIYRLFGLTFTAGVVAWLLRVAVSSLMLAMLPWMSRQLGTGAPAGVVAGLAGALVPRWPTQVEAPAAVALGLLLVAFVHRWRTDQVSMQQSALLGLAWGAAFHITPSLLPVLAGCLAFEVWWRRGHRPWRAAAILALGVVIACVPWTWRNYAVFGELVFIRSNAGLELRMGNHAGAAADIEVMDALEGDAMHHPRVNPDDARLVQAIGEVEYMRRARREALGWIAAHPAAFLRLTARRAQYFWFGAPSDPWRMVFAGLLTVLGLVGLRRAWPTITTPQRAAFVIPLATYPLVYYLVVYMPRYGEPLNGLLLVLAGAAAWSWTTARARAAIAAAGVGRSD